MMDDIMYVRGIPVSREEVIFHQERLGAALFDECVFKTKEKRQACANVIVELDYKLRKLTEVEGLVWQDNVVAVDIGDPSWLYIPVPLAPPDDPVIQIIPTKEKPVGLVAWFRMRKQYAKGVRSPNGTI